MQNQHYDTLRARAVFFSIKTKRDQHELIVFICSKFVLFFGKICYIIVFLHLNRKKNKQK